MIYFYLFLLVIDKFLQINAAVFYPQGLNVGKFKPVSLNPLGGTCGVELAESLCENRFQNSKLCTNSSSVINCDQTCPYGRIVQNTQKIEQLKLELMEPCEIVRDYGILLAKSESTSSYFFDKNNNLCDSDRVKRNWKPFPLISSTVSSSSESIVNTGFSLILWFQQYISNNG